LANMSHELRTPLNSIIVLAQLMAESVDLHPKEREYAATIHSSGNDLLVLINDILDLSKIEAGKMEIRVDEVSIVDVCLAMEQMFDRVAEKKGVAFRVDHRTDLPATIRTDPLRLKQILQNLLSNAFKFTEVGEVTLTVRSTAQSDPSGHRAIEFVVSDTGIGIPADKQELVFEAFQQADGTINRKYGGTGLGLSISRQLASALGARISFSSVEGEGSSFSLFMPVVYGEPSHESEPRRRPTPVDSPTTRVEERMSEGASGEVRDDRHTLRPEETSLLIIASDKTFAQLVAEQARTRGFKILHARDGETGLHFADYYRPSAVILDVDLPGIDGWEVTERLQENRFTAHIPIHIIAADTETPTTVPPGAIAHIPKPVTVASLQRSLQRIETVLDKSVQHVLILETDRARSEAIRDLIESREVKTTSAETIDDGLTILKDESVDCAILDADLKESLDFLRRLREDESVDTPVIVYTGEELTRDDEAQLSRYAESITVKSARSQERLLDETMLFLHRVERRLPSQKTPQREPVPHEEEPVLRDKTILIVDDDMRSVFALTSVLEDRGVHVVAARHGREAVEKIQSMERVDGVLMDIMMPEMDGYEATQKIREQERFRKLPIIALTAKAMRGDRQKCIDAGATDYLSKPVDVAKLLSLLRVWLYR
ncbi:MAG: response regulator, partial [Spirochaetales bacterium]|nr:response regulator [Spirochaetales bacterium]